MAVVAEDKHYVAVVKEVYNPTGPGGVAKLVKVVFEETNEAFHRVVKGPVQVGDKMIFLDCERDQRNIR